MMNPQRIFTLQCFQELIYFNETEQKKKTNILHTVK